MGNALFQSNYIDYEGNSTNNSFEESVVLPKKIKYNFYLDREFLSNSDLDEETKHILKQKFSINKINLIIKHTKKFLKRKKAQQKLIKTFSHFLKKNNILSKANNENINTNIIINSKTEKDLIAYNKLLSQNFDENEQNKINLMKSSLIINSEKFSKNSNEINRVQLGKNSYSIGKLSPNKKKYYLKTVFDNETIFKSYQDQTTNIQYGIYYYYKLGLIYEGYWKDNKKNGIGIEKKLDGSLYEGEFKNGKKNGIGIYYWKDNSVYFGNWLDNNCHGFGVFKNGNKSKYQGEFLYNKRSGYGELIKYNNGSFYFGFWSNNKRKGFGVEFSHRKDENAKIYVGFWNGDYRHGYGLILNKYYKTMYGMWKKNQAKEIFKTKTEFDNKIKNYVDANLIPFFNKTFGEYEEIFKQMIDSSEFIFNYFD